MEKIMVFIPMYNCEKQITRVLKQMDKEVMQYVSKIVIINNRSTDKGEEKAIKYAKDKLPIVVLRNDENYNLGGSHKVAFAYAKKEKYDYVIVLHGDDQGNIHDLLPILKSGEYKNYDCVLGSRFLKKSKLEGYSLLRTLGNKVFNGIYTVAMKKPCKDLGSGLNMYKVSMFKKEYYKKYPDRLTFNCYMLLATKSYHQKIKFFPITWREDDQVSNVKMVSQAWMTWKLAFLYFIKGTSYLEKEHRSHIIQKYTATQIYPKEGRKNEK